ncbi:SCO family protein [Rubritalea marina]|uniref:SCO family protein n=1 Tax=Rubritalea marina TaxID=361055 RepID=UPI00036798B8|nr:SCO family protein [Rubritalea marina]
MSQRSKVIAIYSGVAVIVAILLVIFNWLGAQRKAKSDAAHTEHLRQLQAGGIEVVAPLTPLDKQLTADLAGTNQDGDAVSLFDLKGKVFVFAQFYSRCSMCLGYNKQVITELQKALSGNPNVHFVTVTIDPEFDTPEKLKESAEVWGADSKNWWMLNVPKDTLTSYCREQLWYIDFTENKKKTSAADALNHDMGIAVIDTNSKLRAKVNLFELLENDQVELYEVKKSQIIDVVNMALKEAGK